MSENERGICPFCDSGTGPQTEVMDGGLNVKWNCPVCGEIYCHERLHRIRLPALNGQEKAMVAAFLHERKVSGRDVTVIAGEPSPDGQEEPDVVTLDAILGYMKHVFESPRERMNHALLRLARMSAKPGALVRVTHPAVVYAEDGDVQRFLLGALADAEYVRAIETCDPSESRVALTVHGWTKAAELEQERRGVDSTDAFVAMWFDEKMDEAYEKGIKPAIEEAGYGPVRIDRNISPGKICDEIIAQIRKSRFLVADFTGGRQGVYFEAGFAMGLGIPVIWTVREDRVKTDLHFDTRQYRHIDWKDVSDLRTRLRMSIEANIPRPVARRDDL